MVITRGSELPKPEEVRIPGFRQWFVGKLVIRQNVMYDGNSEVVYGNGHSWVYTECNGNIGEYIGTIPTPRIKDDGELHTTGLTPIIIEAIEEQIKNLSDKQHRLKEMIEELK